jgi:glycosyltransferase involved in cell wall biosynthesis
VRVAFDTSSARGAKTGIGSYTVNLICALRKASPEFEVVELVDHADTDQSTPRRILREQIVIPHLAARARANILHLTGFAAPWRAQCPVVLNAHDLAGVRFARNFPPVSRIYWSRYLPFTLRFASRLIVLSESTKREIASLDKRLASRIQVIPPGRDTRFRPIEAKAFLEEGRRRLGLPGQFILFVSTLEPRKGIDTLIASFARIAGRIPDDLVIVGRRGWYWEKLFAMVSAAGLERRVRFLDYVPTEELPLLYNLSSAFVFPSRYEGFGLTVLEAMSCGTAVVCSNASSLPEVVGSAAILVSPDDEEGFARAIVHVTANEELRDGLRAMSLKRAETFSWDRSASAVMQVYNSIIRDAKKRSEGDAAEANG